MNTENKSPLVQSLYTFLHASVVFCLITGILYAIQATGGCLHVYQFLEDMNGDRIYSISDLKEQVKWVALLPGEIIQSWIIAGIPGLAQFLELSVFNCRGTFSAIVSMLSWVLIYLLYLIIRDDP